MNDVGVNVAAMGVLRQLQRSCVARSQTHRIDVGQNVAQQIMHMTGFDPAAASARRVDAGNGKLRQWMDLSAAWHLLTARSLCPDEFDITGSDLLDPWRCYLEQRIHVLRWRGSVATALALHRVDHTDLADRFVAWAHRNDPKGIMKVTQFDGLLEIAGLPTTDVVEIDDLDTLIDQLSIVADELDQRTN